MFKQTNNIAVFLDRDGVVNRAIIRDSRPFPPQSLPELEVLPGVELAISDLKKAGYLIVVVTNQPDVATGVQRKEVVEAINRKLLETLEIDDIRVCFHVDRDGCRCRKPLPGMLLEAAKDWGIDLRQSYMVGDRWRDIEAGERAGCQTILIQNSYVDNIYREPDRIACSLKEASSYILSGFGNDSPDTVTSTDMEVSDGQSN